MSCAAAQQRWTWLAIEPNALSPYTFLRQHLIAGERNVAPRSAVRIGSAHGWRPAGHRYRFLIPPFVKVPAAWMVAVEQRFETVPPLGGGVCIEWVRDSSPRQAAGRAGA